MKNIHRLIGKPDCKEKFKTAEIKGGGPTSLGKNILPLGRDTKTTFGEKNEPSEGSNSERNVRGLTHEEIFKITNANAKNASDV